MELIESGFTIILLMVLLSIFIFSFIDRDSKKNSHISFKMKNHTKISTQDGMVAKKSAKGPLILIGDSKSFK